MRTDGLPAQRHITSIQPKAHQPFAGRGTRIAGPNEWLTRPAVYRAAHAMTVASHGAVFAMPAPRRRTACTTYAASAASSWPWAVRRAEAQGRRPSQLSLFPTAGYHRVPARGAGATVDPAVRTASLATGVLWFVASVPVQSRANDAQPRHLTADRIRFCAVMSDVRE